MKQASFQSLHRATLFSEHGSTENFLCHKIALRAPSMQCLLSSFWKLILSSVNSPSLNSSGCKSESRGHWHGHRPPGGFFLFNSITFHPRWLPALLYPFAWLWLYLCWSFPSVNHFCKMSCGLISGRQKGNIELYLLSAGEPSDRCTVSTQRQTLKDETSMWTEDLTAEFELYLFLSKYILLTEISAVFEY